jgi:hypothetical protein
MKIPSIAQTMLNVDGSNEGIFAPTPVPLSIICGDAIVDRRVQRR